MDSIKNHLGVTTMEKTLDRRDFLKFAAAGAASIPIFGMGKQAKGDDCLEGRINCSPDYEAVKLTPAIKITGGTMTEEYLDKMAFLLGSGPEDAVLVYNGSDAGSNFYDRIASTVLSGQKRSEKYPFLRLDDGIDFPAQRIEPCNLGHMLFSMLDSTHPPTGENDLIGISMDAVESTYLVPYATVIVNHVNKLLSKREGKYPATFHKLTWNAADTLEPRAIELLNISNDNLAKAAVGNEGNNYGLINAVHKYANGVMAISGLATPYHLEKCGFDLNRVDGFELTHGYTVKFVPTMIECNNCQ